MTKLFRVLRGSRPIQGVLIFLAAAFSLLPLVAEKLQGNSIRWTTEGDQVHCEYFQVPSFSHVRSYEHERILDVTRAPDSTDPSVEVVRFSFNGLNYNIPSQSTATICCFDRYLARLQSFMREARSGNEAASLVWYHPWLVTGVAAALLAVAVWVLVFSVLLLGPAREPVVGRDPEPGA
jgi:hypothetical protein